MRSITRSILAAMSVVGLLAIPVAGASADTTTVTFQVTNTGGLSVATASATTNIGPHNTASGTTLTAALPKMTVTDNTNPLLGGWTVSVAATSFSDGAVPPKTIAGTKIGYFSGIATATLATVVVPVGQQTALTPVTLDAARTAVVATGATGNNSAEFTPSLTIDLTGVPAATYSGNIVHSVLAN